MNHRRGQETSDGVKISCVTPLVSAFPPHAGRAHTGGLWVFWGIKGSGSQIGLCRATSDWIASNLYSANLRAVGTLAHFSSRVKNDKIKHWDQKWPHLIFFMYVYR